MVRGSRSRHSLLCTCGHGGTQTSGGRESQLKHKVKPKEREKRKNGFVRQGEWFFIPCADLEVHEYLALQYEPLRRGRGKTHVGQFLFRRGGDAVWVRSEFPNGISEALHARVLHERPGWKNMHWQYMRLAPEAFIMGKIRPPDHKTVVLNCWHRVVPNCEDSEGGRVAFLD